MGDHRQYNIGFVSLRLTVTCGYMANKGATDMLEIIGGLALANLLGSGKKRKKKNNPNIQINVNNFNLGHQPQQARGFAIQQSTTVSSMSFVT
jgi:hypothetical protein